MAEGVASNMETRLQHMLQKLEHVARAYKKLQKENVQLKQALAKAEADAASRLQQVEDLRQQVEILKFAAGEMGEADKKNFEKRLNQYIRDVEKCIAVLSE